MIAPEDVDLGRLKAAFARRVSASAREGFVVGRTNLRDCAISELDCGAAMAEQLIDTMVVRGLIRYSEPAEPGGHGMWLVSQD